jgi:hypothetical protein
MNMKKIHINEDAEILKLFDAGLNLGEYRNEEEKNVVESVRYRWTKLQDEISSFRDYVEEKRDMALSERASNELNDILEEIDVMIG